MTVKASPLSVRVDTVEFRIITASNCEKLVSETIFTLLTHTFECAE